jgi:hypothetical protein
MSMLRTAVVLAALVVCANAQWLNFGTYAEDFEPAAGFVLTTVNDNTNLLRGNRAGLLQSSTVIVVKVGPGVMNLREGQTVYPALQRAIDTEGRIVNAEVGVDTRAFCPQPIDLNPPLIGEDAFLGTANPAGFVPNPIWQIEDPLHDSTSIRGNYCIYHESQIAAIINNQATRGSVGSSQIFNSYGFASNIPGTTRPTL